MYIELYYHLIKRKPIRILCIVPFSSISHIYAWVLCELCTVYFVPMYVEPFKHSTIHNQYLHCQLPSNGYHSKNSLMSDSTILKYFIDPSTLKTKECPYQCTCAGILSWTYKSSWELKRASKTCLSLTLSPYTDNIPYSTQTRI